MKIDHSRDGDVHTVRLCDGENRIDLGFVAELSTVLDAVEASSHGPCALVLTGEGKFFSNGLDVDRLMALPADELARFGREFSQQLARLVCLPVPTVAALNGHAFAGGAVLALAFDYRFMREDRGWICLSEVDVGVPIDPGMMALVRAKLPAAIAARSVLEGHRFAAPEAVASGWADALAPEHSLLEVATEQAARLAQKERTIFATLKRRLWHDVAVALTPDAAGGPRP